MSVVDFRIVKKKYIPINYYRYNFHTKKNKKLIRI